MLLISACAAVIAVSSSPQSVFSDEAIKDCTRIRTPELVKSGEQHWHVFATCCGENACGHKTRRRLGSNSNETANNVTLGDNHSEARIIMATSKDKDKAPVDQDPDRILSPAEMEKGGGIDISAAVSESLVDL